MGHHCDLHMDVSRLVVESELQLLAYATATAMQDPSHVYDLQHSSRQCWILNQLSEARVGTHILMDTSWTYFCRTTVGIPTSIFNAEKIEAQSLSNLSSITPLEGSMASVIVTPEPASFPSYSMVALSLKRGKECQANISFLTQHWTQYRADALKDMLRG